MYSVVEGGGGVARFGVLYKITGDRSQAVGGICQQCGLDGGISVDTQARCMGMIDVIDSLRVSRRSVSSARFAHIELVIVE